MTRIRRADVLVGAVGMAVAGASVWVVPGTEGLLGAALALLMLAIALIDLRHFIIPNELSAAALALALINAAIAEPAAIVEGVVAALLRGIATMLLFWAVRVAYSRLRRREGIGLGDVKLAGVAGVWLDWLLIPVAIEIAAVAALIAYLNWPRIVGAPTDATTRLPFGLFFAPAIWLTWLLGTALAAHPGFWYFG